MSDILLIQPPVGNPINKSQFTIPLGLAYLARVLQDNAYSVTVLDMGVEKTTRTTLSAILSREMPKLVGITSTVLTYNDGIRVASFIKKQKPNLPIVIGGPQASFLPEQTLEKGCIDIVAISEGEITMLEIAEYYINGDIFSLSKIKDIAYKHNGQIVINERRPFIENLDTIGFPARDLFDLNKYENPFSIITGRGCPHACTFCTNQNMWRRRYRVRSIDNVVKEIIEIRDKYKPDMIHFIDDTFILDHERVVSICDESIEKHIHVIWSCSSRGKPIPSYVLKKLREAGCRGIIIGAESGSNRVLRNIKKGVTKQDIEETVKGIHRAGIGVVCSFIIGFPCDTERSINETIQFAKQLASLQISKNEPPVLSQFGAVMPLPGTELFDNLPKRDRLFLMENWDRYDFSTPIITPKNLSKREMQNYMCKALKVGITILV